MKLSEAEAGQAIRHADRILALTEEEIAGDQKACQKGLLEITDNVLKYLRRAPRVGMSARIVKLTMLRNGLAQPNI